MSKAFLVMTVLAVILLTGCQKAPTEQVRGARHRSGSIGGSSFCSGYPCVDDTLGPEAS